MIIDLIIALVVLLIIFTDFLFHEIKNQHLFCLLIVKGFYIYFYGVVSVVLTCVIVCVFCILYFLSIKNLIGGGDVKLITVLIIGLGIEEICNFLINMSFIGGIEVVTFILLEKQVYRLRNTCYKIIKYKLVSKILCSVNQKLIIPVVNSYLKREIPYGIAIGFGFLLSMFR